MFHFNVTSHTLLPIKWNSIRPGGPARGQNQTVHKTLPGDGGAEGVGGSWGGGEGGGGGG